VGNDFTGNFAPVAFPAGADLSKRVPWANEAKCQSCRTGDVLDSAAGAHPDVLASDGIRLMQAYVNGPHTDGSKIAQVIEAPNSRFAENQPLFRLSTGHGGLKCESCHGSTHAIWPVSPEQGPFAANDNVAALQLQGHTGAITECSTCHEGDLGNTLEGPHGMLPVGNTSFARGGHGDLAEHNPDACRACHGRRGDGSVLATTAAQRVLESAERGRLTLTRGTPVRCDACHENEL